LRLRFVEGGVEMPSEAARRVEGTPVEAVATP